LSSRFLLSALSSPHFPFSFFTWVGHPLQWDLFICICPKKNSSFYSSSGRSPGTIRPLAKPFSRFILIGQVAWNNLTTRETLFAFYSYRAGRLEQFEHSRNPFRVLFFIGQVAWNNLTTRETLFAFYSSSGRSPGTVWPLAKPFSHFIFPIGQVVWNN